MQCFSNAIHVCMYMQCRELGHATCILAKKSICGDFVLARSTKVQRSFVLCDHMTHSHEPRSRVVPMPVEDIPPQSLQHGTVDLPVGAEKPFTSTLVRVSCNQTVTLSVILN